jgi:hypothetical protein
MSERPTPIELLTSNTNEQKILATLGRIEKLLIAHFDGDADRPAPPKGKRK